MTPYQKNRIDQAFKEGTDALRFLRPHLSCPCGIPASDGCLAYLELRQEELDLITSNLPTFVPAARFNRRTGRYEELRA